MTDKPDQIPLLSPYWYRVASLKPRLRADVRITRQPTRGTDWFVLSRRDHTGQMRLNPAAWEVIARCDGNASLEAIWRHLGRSCAEALPSQNHLLPVLAQLVRQGLLHCDDWPDLDEQDRQRQEDARKARWQRLNPLAPRLRLGDPTRLIKACHKPVESLIGAWGGMLAMMLIVLAALTAWLQWTPLGRAVPAAFSDGRFLVLTWCLYPLVKLLHELAHGVMLRHFGGRTPEIGVALLMLMPAPYVDATDANRLERGLHRAIVSAAGIGAELMLAALAMLLWPWVEPGLLRDGLLAIIVIGSVSTVVFNANPLIRFDGYYVLTDLLGLPGLAERSTQWWRHLWQQRLLGLPAGPGALNPDERFWLVAYAPAAWAYRLSLLLWLANWLGSYSRVVGFGLLAIALMTQFVLPVGRLIAMTGNEGVSLGQSFKARVRLAVALIALAGVSLVPVPDRATVQAVASLPDSARVKATQAGYVVDASDRDHREVASDTTVLALHDPLLDAQINTQISLVAGLESQWMQTLSGADPSMSQAHRKALEQARQRLAFLYDNQRKLQIDSPASGQFRLVQLEQDLPGRFIEPGDLLGVVRQPGDVVLRAALNEDQANRLRESETRTARVWHPGKRASESGMAARLTALTPDAINSLPSPALASRAGGPVTIDEAAGELTPAHPTYLADLVSESSASPQWVAGQRVWVRLDFGHRSLLAQGVRALGQMINTQMAPGWS